MEECKVRREGDGEEERGELDKEHYRCAVSFWTAFSVALSWRTGGDYTKVQEQEGGTRGADQACQCTSQKGKGGSMKRRVDGERADGHTGSWAGMSRHGRPDQMASGIDHGVSASRRTD